MTRPQQRPPGLTGSSRIGLGVVALGFAAYDVTQFAQAPGIGHAMFDLALVLAGVVMIWRGLAERRSGEGD